ncbi:MAG: acetate--CoA ligase family protein, partial [Anaerolineales bacterium]
SPDILHKSDVGGVLRADSAEQLFDWARALADCPLPRGRSFAILTDAGGPGVMAADALEKNGLHLAQLSDATLKALSALLPPAANIHNPVDMLASASPETYAACLKSLLEDEAVDGVLVILPPPPMFRAEDVAEKVVAVLAAGDGGSSTRYKPVVVSLMGSTLVEKARDRFQCANIPTYPFPERAASALGVLVKRAEFLDDGPLTMDHGKRSMVHRPWSNIEELLGAYDIPTAPIRLARSVEEAAAIADELGYPVVMKIASPDILHKSDVGGVLLNIKDPAALQVAYTQIWDRVGEALPEARLDGIQVQRQIPDGQEVIVGAVRDPQFGPLMMFGSGGVEVEGLKDVAFALAPLDEAEAAKLIRRTWAGRKLKGFRNIPPADEEAVIDVLIKLSHLVLENEAIAEIEINPLRVLDNGAVAVDVRVK